MQNCDKKREEEEDENLPEESAAKHTFAGADFAQDAILTTIVATLGELFERKDGGARN